MNRWCQLAVASPLLLAGCLTPPAEKTGALDMTPPPAFSAEEALADAGPFTPGWLTRFADPDLQAAVALAVERNFSLQVAAARLDQALALATVDGAARLPSLDLTGGASDRRTQVNNQVDPPLTRRADSFDLGLRLTWEIDLWGRVRAGAYAAESDAQAAAADFEAARLSLAGQVTSAWFEAIAARAQAELSRETVASFEANLQTVEERFRRGLSPALDVRLTRANVANARATLAAQERSFDVVLRRLEVLLGAYPEGAFTLSDALPALETTVPVGLPSSLLTRRPDVVAAERRLVAADYRLSQSEANRWPAFSLTGTYGQASGDLEDLLKDGFDVWSLAGNLTAPLFQGGRINANIDRADARVREAAANYAQVALNAFSEVETALASESLLRAQLAAVEEAAEESVGAQELAEERYQRGLVDIITVLESQRRAFNARSQALTIRNLLLQNRVALHVGLGGDF